MKLVPFVDADGETIYVNPEHVQLVQPALDDGHSIITFSYEDDVAVIGTAKEVVDKLVIGGTL